LIEGAIQVGLVPTAMSAKLCLDAYMDHAVNFPTPASATHTGKAHCVINQNASKSS